MAKWKWEKVDKLTGTETFLKNVPGFYGNGTRDVDTRSAQWAPVRQFASCGIRRNILGRLKIRTWGVHNPRFAHGVLSGTTVCPSKRPRGHSITPTPPAIYSFNTHTQCAVTSLDTAAPK